MGEPEVRNYVYLRGLLDSFQQKALQYYNEATTPEARFDRLKEIRTLLLNQSHPNLSVAQRRRSALAEALDLKNPDYPDCPDGQVCRGGACVDANLPLADWPAEGDPED